MAVAAEACAMAVGNSTTVIPQGVGAPPYSDATAAVFKAGKLMCIRVQLLDDSVSVFHLSHRSLGAAIYDQVYRHLNLIEADYFGLQFVDCDGCECWLEKSKRIVKQLSSYKSEARLYLIVKFYPASPADLEEEYTRYLFALQIKRDLASGQLFCNENTAAMLASYIVQSECGDFCPQDYPDHTYLSTGCFVPDQTPQFEQKIMENHKKLVGMMPAECDVALLETVRRCEFYGCKFHQAKDGDGNAVNLTVLHLGIKVYHMLHCANTFSWAKIRKLCFKRKHFLIKLHPEGYGLNSDTIAFLFETRHECKMFWKKCVEYHCFFRCAEVSRMAKNQGKWFAKGCSFRYDGRTQKQLIEYLREHVKKREPFSRPVASSICRNDPRRYTLPLMPYDDGSVKMSKSDSDFSGSSYVNYKPKKKNVEKKGDSHTLPKSKKVQELSQPNAVEKQNGTLQTPQPRSEMFIYETTERLRESAKEQPSADNENVSQASYHLSETELTQDQAAVMSASVDSSAVFASPSSSTSTFRPIGDNQERPKSTENVQSGVKGKVEEESSGSNEVIKARTKPIPPPKPKLGLSNLKLLPLSIGIPPLGEIDRPRYAVVKHKVLDGDIPYTLHVRELRVMPKPDEKKGPAPPPGSMSTFKSAPAASLNECVSSATTEPSEAKPASEEQCQPRPTVSSYVKTLSTEV